MREVDEMASKLQLVFMARPEQVDDLDVLRIVMSSSRAEVCRLALDQGIPKLKTANRERIARLSKYAAEHGVTVREVAVAYANTYAKVTYGATLEELESGVKKLPLNDEPAAVVTK